MDITALLTHQDLEVREHEPLREHASYRIGGPARWYLTPHTYESCRHVWRILHSREVPVFILGAGANVLFSDEGYPGAVIETAALDEIRFSDGGVATAQCGVVLQTFIEAAAKHKLGGYAELSGIPGTIGGNVKMNAGAFGAQICDHLMEVRLLTGSGRLVRKDKSRLGFGYRRSSIRDDDWLLEATFQLPPADGAQVLATRDATINRRLARQPAEFPSCGSVFKKAALTPIGPATMRFDADKYGEFGGIPAGALIEAAGLKGLSHGGAQISEKHANFIINTGGALAADVLFLINAARREVYSQTGFVLEPEVRLVGLELDPFA